MKRLSHFIWYIALFSNKNCHVQHRCPPSEKLMGIIFKAICCKVVSSRTYLRECFYSFVAQRWSLRDYEINLHAITLPTSILSEKLYICFDLFDVSYLHFGIWSFPKLVIWINFKYNYSLLIRPNNNSFLKQEKHPHFLPQAAEIAIIKQSTKERSSVRSRFFLCSNRAHDRFHVSSTFVPRILNWRTFYCATEVSTIRISGLFLGYSSKH